MAESLWTLSIEAFMISATSVVAYLIGKRFWSSKKSNLNDWFSKTKSVFLSIAVIAFCVYIFITMSDPETGLSPDFNINLYLRILVPIVTGFMFSFPAVFAKQYPEDV